jgi:nucleoside-triphosphatase THEP1
MGTRLLDQAEHRSYAVLDELGGVELLDASFVRALVRLLQGDTPCLGVLRAEGDAGKAVGGMGLHLRYELARRVLLDHLKKDPEVIVLETTGKNDPEARKLVAQWVSEYAKTE